MAGRVVIPVVRTDAGGIARTACTDAGPSAIGRHVVIDSTRGDRVRYGGDAVIDGLSVAGTLTPAAIFHAPGLTSGGPAVATVAAA